MGSKLTSLQVRFIFWADFLAWIEPREFVEGLFQIQSHEIFWRSSAIPSSNSETSWAALSSIFWIDSLLSLMLHHLSSHLDVPRITDVLATLCLILPRVGMTIHLGIGLCFA